VTICAQCGHESLETNKFCGACGALLGVAVGERRERRVVSVLFADLVGFTSRSERLDVEDVEGFLAPYHAMLERVVGVYGGVVCKFIGDGVMVVFGAPVAHEDDPERAVRCAIAIRDQVSDAVADGGRLRVRVGVTSGEALVSLGASGEVDAVGDVVNTAARLESAASVDGVLVDEWTYRATSRTIRYDEAEPVEAKGKAEPVVVWAALEPVSVLPEQARDELPLVGRGHERALLVQALAGARGEPAARLVTLVGAPGIGKTRLVSELRRHVDENPDLTRWRRGRSLSYGEGVAFWALGEIVKGEAGISESDSASAAEVKLAGAIAAVIDDSRDREWVLRHLRPLVGVAAVESVRPEDGRVEAFAAWRRFLEALAEDDPTVLVFEDIHWADDALLDFIDLVADRAGSVPLLIICTARPELLERRPAWSGGKTNATTTLLSPLSDEDTARLVGELLDQALLPAELQRSLLELAEGNPLYAQEYVRMLQDQGLLVHGDGGWTLTGEVEGLPESVQGIIAARLGTLTNEETELVQDAAVVGKTCWVGAVCAISDSSVWEVEELLHGLERKQLLRRSRRSSVAGEAEFSFAHSLTQEVAYGQIRRAKRAEKHERAAIWIERLAGERDDKAELLAGHYQNALTLREQLGEDTTSLTPKARAALTEAGHQAAAVSAHAASARHYNAALRLTPDDDPTRPSLLLGEATARFYSGNADEQILRAALDAQVAAEDWEGAAMTESLVAQWYEKHEARIEDAEVHTARGAAYAARIPPSEVMCLIASDQAFRLTVSGRAEEALALTNRVLPIAEQAGLQVGRALLLQWRGSARITLGDADGIHDMQSAAHTSPTKPTGRRLPRMATWLTSCADWER
jgi:class 3 adenylate cyclase